MRNKVFRYRIEPTKNQERELLIQMETHRRIYNAALEWKQHAWETLGANVTAYDIGRWVTRQRETNEHWKRTNSGSIQCTLATVDQAFKNFFGRVKKGQKPGYPRFKGKYQLPSLTYRVPKDGGAKLVGGKLQMQFIGKVRIRQHRPLEGKLKRIQVTCDVDGKWYACFLCELPEIDVAPSANPSVGIDVGLEKFATTSQGEKIANPRFLKAALPGLRRQQRSLSRKRKGGSNRNKQRKQVAKLHVKVRNQRKDFHYKKALELTRRFGVIAVESLNIRGMVRNGRLAKSIVDAGWGQFITILKHKAEEAGVEVIEVNPNGTSQACSACGATVKKDLSVRVHRCSCGLKMDRDQNAALNILARAKQGGIRPVGAKLGIA